MARDHTAEVMPGSGMHHAEVKMLAARALRVLATKSAPRSDNTHRHLNTLCDAFVSVDEEARHTAILRILQEGMTPKDVVAHIIPETARLLGLRWASDELSFAEVSIASARLQETVRALVAKERRIWNDPRGTILMVVPRPEHHTLGIFVAADRFRRLGYDVDFSVADHSRQIVGKIVKKRYDMVGITASSRRSLAFARELVDSIRTRVPRRVAVVVGGSVLDLDLDVMALTGADHVSADPQRALDLCGLEISSDKVLERTAAE